MDLSDKTAVITGGNSGIGAAIAGSLAQAGASLVIAGRTTGRNEAVADSLHKRHGVKVVPVTADVSREADCKELVKRARDQFGRLDILVNNAGIGGGGRIAETTTEDLERVMRTNLYSAFWCSRAAWPLLEANPPDPQTGLRGSILHVSSLCGVDAWAGVGIYAMSKHGMVALSRALADEGVEPRIRSCAICPALVATPMTGADESDAIAAGDIAAAAMHLLSLSSNAWPREYVINRRSAG